MTFDDGILKIYSAENISDEGDLPLLELVYKSSSYFKFEDLGIQRYYTALSHNQLIDSVVAVHYDRNIKVFDIIVIDGVQFKIDMVQHPFDEDGLRYTKLSLERLNDEFKFKT